MRRQTLLSLLMLTPASACAGTFTREALTLDEGNASAQLAATGQRYVDAMHHLIEARWRDAYSARRWETLETALAHTPVARLEYRAPDGTVARIYHAMGGAPLGELAAETFTGPSRPSTPDSMDGSDVEIDDTNPSDRAARLEKYARVDAEDAAMFSPDNALHMRARLRSTEGTLFHPYTIDGEDRALDAEFKAVAALEGDLLEGNVPRGGKATILLSGETCNSCDYAMRAAAMHYDIDVHLVRMMSRPTPAEGKTLIAGGKARWRGTRLVDQATGRPLLAADTLDGLREAQVRQAITPAAMSRRFANIPWEPRAVRLTPPEGKVPPGEATAGTPPDC